AVVLLASYRTGLKMAMWYALLLFTVFFATRDGAFGLGPIASTGPARWDLGQMCAFVGALWLVAIAAAAFSAVNERELRRRRFDLEALARFAVELEDATDRQTVGATLLDSLADAFPVQRLLLVTAGRWPAVLAHRGATIGSAPRSSCEPPPRRVRGTRATGLSLIANRRTFEDTLQREVARSIRSGEPVSVVMLDIDDFKRLNDTHGHQVGDEVLRQVASTLAATCREFDTPARYGGEEFAV